MARDGGRAIAVLGAGAWGTALANLVARGGEGAGREPPRVLLYARDPGHVAEMTATGVNARRLPGVPLLSNVAPTAELAEVAEADVLLAVVPTQALRALLGALAPLIAGAPPVVACAKGIERGTGSFVTDIVNDVMPRSPAAILSGPSFARDVARGLPTAVTLAARDPVIASTLAAMIAAPSFRVYSTSDVRGVEIGGSAKNVLAIASGIAAGRELGASAGAALIARGFAELSRFGRAYEAEPATLTGLSGLGDLVLTCTSALSRNYSFGFALGEGASMAEATERVGLAEGVFTCGVMLDLAQAAQVDIPIAAAVDAVLAERLGVDEAIAQLLARPSKPES